MDNIDYNDLLNEALKILKEHEFYKNNLSNNLYFKKYLIEKRTLIIRNIKFLCKRLENIASDNDISLSKDMININKINSINLIVSNYSNEFYQLNGVSIFQSNNCLNLLIDNYYYNYKQLEMLVKEYEKVIDILENKKDKKLTK